MITILNSREFLESEAIKSEKRKLKKQKCYARKPQKSCGFPFAEI